MDKQILADVHYYWFGELKSPTDVPHDDKMKLWFGAPPEVDDDIRAKFGGHLDPANATDWDLDALTRVEQMGLIVLLDQFPRHIFRASGQQFAYDPKAKEVAAHLVKGGADRFYPVERTFLFLPFEHSENLADQDHSVWLFAGHMLAAPEPTKTGLRMAFDYAYKHWDIIKKFGRFPHRNALLGRESTPEELEFLKSGRGF